MDIIRHKGSNRVQPREERDGLEVAPLQGRAAEVQPLAQHFHLEPIIVPEKVIGAVPSDKLSVQVRSQAKLHDVVDRASIAPERVDFRSGELERVRKALDVEGYLSKLLYTHPLGKGSL